MGVKKLKANAEGTYPELPKTAREAIEELVIETMKANSEGYPSCNTGRDDGVEELEFEARSGFIPFDHNRGGIQLNMFTDIGYYWGSGCRPAHKDAANEIERQIELGLNYASEMLSERMGKEDFEYFFGSDLKKLTYHNLQELAESLTKQGQDTTKVDFWVQEIQELENANLSGDESSIMHQTRFMYHGKVDGVHSASVSCAVNTEGPYHRSHISWAPGVFCEGVKEVEITWKTVPELKKKLKAALDKTAKVIF